MSSDEGAGPSRPKRAKNDAASLHNFCGLDPGEVREILKNVGDFGDCYVSSEDEPFSASGSEYKPDTSSESEGVESDNESLENENDTKQGNVEEDSGNGRTQPLEEMKIDWTDNEFKPQKHAFMNDQSGINPDMNLNQNSTEIDYFSNLFTDDIADIIVRETNRYAAENAKRWKDLDRSEFYEFLALNLLMPRNKKLSIHEYWSTDPLLCSPIFGQCMSRDRFTSIYRYLHFCNNEEAVNHDRLFKIRTFLEKIKERFKIALYPFECLVIDESLVLFKGRLIFKQYIKSKRHRFGIKLYVLCDCETGYILDFIVYVGKDTYIVNDTNPLLGITGAVVTKLLTPYLDKGHSLYTDNFYTSPSLSLYLLDRKTNTCGTVRQNRRGMPELRGKLNKGEISWKSSDRLLALKWKDRRDVTMLSTMHENKIIALPKLDRKTGENIKKPLCVLDYNKNMGAVDRSDMLTSSIDCMRKNIKWYKKLFFHVADLCILNSHALFLTQTAKKVPLAVFHLNVTRQLLERNALHRKVPPAVSSAGKRLTERHFPSLVPATEKSKRAMRRCVVCANTSTGVKKRKESRYMCKDCNPCPELPPEFREEQCAAFDNFPYEGEIYQWTPFDDDDEPCALTCKGKPEGAGDDVVLVVVKLKDKVHDGTRCRPGSLDMCIDGRCQRVGCDLRIGSTKQVDECGVCGGDGSSCAKPLYHWTLTFASLCSSTCGGGYKMSRPVCQNRISGEEVEEELCNDSQKPDATVVECNLHNCPPKWHAGEWSLCSVTCGGGSRLRQVHCVEETNNTKIRVDESKCGGYKPWFQEACNQMDCPTWFTTKWSGCSVSCGEGIQTRGVDCRDSRDQPSDLCDAKSKPETTQACSTGITCPFHIDTSEELMPGLYHTQPLVQPYPPPPVPERLVGEQTVPSESTFIPDEWGPCSVTCGEGVRRREVHCKIFLEFSRTIAKLPDKQCSGIKPVEVEKCYREPCTAEKISMDVKDDPSNIKVGSGSPAKSYSWKEQGFTHCSASCLGGVQELIVNCVRDDTQKVTSPFMCPIELKPEVIIRACNEHSCPPRWSYTEFSPCSQSCGIGIQTRDVNCIHELTQGGSNTVVVPNNRCPQPPPPDRQYCNVLDCPVRWKVSEWSKCSKTCGGGEKTRKVECKQVMAQNHTVDRPIGMCPSPKPLEKKPCNTKSCIIESDKPHISVTNSTFIQHDPKKKKITVKVGGAATLFTGTTVKIKCPVKRFDKSKIQWKKDNNILPQNKKYKSSKKGALRVQSLTLRDMGTYTCVAGKSLASIAISVRPKPGEFPTSEEIQKHYKTDLISGVNTAKTEGKPIYADDQSHEQRPDGTKKKHYKLFSPTSTSSSLTLDGYVLDSQTTEDSGNKQKDKISNLPSSSSELLNTPNYGDSSSSASRVMPNFLSLISKIQILGFKPQSSRGHRMVTFPGSQEQIVATDQAILTTSSNEVNEVVLGKGTLENLKFEWIVTEWSRCSQTCGGNGVQKRTAKCVVKLHNITQGADNNLCDDAGIPIPKTNKKCGFGVCPQWSTSQWSSCEKAKCFALHKAIQKRAVKCQMGGNLRVDMNKCDPHQKPGQRQECHNEKCVGKWKAGSWAKCSADCEQTGEKYRILQCVWYGTKIPAGNACKALPKPPTRKPCKGGPCGASTAEECQDRSMFCANVKSLNMCKIIRYKQQCCEACKEQNED